MFEKTHARIAKEIARELKLSKEHSDLLEFGSTRPDSYIEFPHHKGKEDLIFADILDARALFLNNDDEAFVKLGEACHFIADKWTLKPRIDVKHFQYESSIESCNFQDDSQFSQEIKQSTIPSKSKIYYEDLTNAIKELMSCEKFTSKRALITELVEKNKEQLASKQELFMNTYLDQEIQKICDLEPNWLESSRADLRIDSSEYIPFPIISHLAWVSREGTVAENYSNPTIDLNISLRLSLSLSNFVLSKKDMLFPKDILNWNKFPLGWKIKIVHNIEELKKIEKKHKEAEEEKRTIERKRIEENRKWERNQKELNKEINKQLRIKEEQKIIRERKKLHLGPSGERGPGGVPVCWHCGNEIKTDYLFCVNCGESLK